MMDFPDSFADETQKLNQDLLDEADAAAARQMEERGYEVHVGLTPAFAEAIAVMAEEAGIREYCPKDLSERFTDRAAAERWLSKKRSTFLLLKRMDDGSLALAGYGWAGTGSNDHAPGGKTTFALRIGEIGQGQGLAAPFSRLIIAATAALYGAADFWLETWGSNGAAVHIYHKLGFETVDEEPGERHSPGGERVPDTRIYMLLPNRLLPGQPDGLN